MVAPPVAIGGQPAGAWARRIRRGNATRRRTVIRASYVASASRRMGGGWELIVRFLARPARSPPAPSGRSTPPVAATTTVAPSRLHRAWPSVVVATFCKPAVHCQRSGVPHRIGERAREVRRDKVPTQGLEGLSGF